MKGRKEFMKRFVSDEAFRSKFAGIESEDKISSTARAEGYDLEKLSDEDLDNVAGGTTLETAEILAFLGSKLEKSFFKTLPGEGEATLKNKYGISANLDCGLFNTGYREGKNTYFDLITKKEMTHEQVLYTILNWGSKDFKLPT